MRASLLALGLFFSLVGLPALSDGSGGGCWFSPARAEEAFSGAGASASGPAQNTPPHDAQPHREQPHKEKAAKPAPALDPSQAQQLLSVLNNPVKRKEFTQTLQNMSKVQTTLDHKEDQSLLDQGWAHISAFSEHLLGKSQALIQDVTNFHAFVPWTHHVLKTPSLQVEIARICLRVAIMIIGGLALSYGMAYLLRIPRRKLEEAAKRMSEREIMSAEKEAARAEEQAERLAELAKEAKEKARQAAEKKAHAEAAAKQAAEQKAATEAEKEKAASPKPEAQQTAPQKDTASDHGSETTEPSKAPAADHAPKPNEVGTSATAASGGQASKSESSGDDEDSEKPLALKDNTQIVPHHETDSHEGGTHPSESGAHATEQKAATEAEKEKAASPKPEAHTSATEEDMSALATGIPSLSDPTQLDPAQARAEREKAAHKKEEAAQNASAGQADLEQASSEANGTDGTQDAHKDSGENSAQDSSGATPLAQAAIVQYELSETQPPYPKPLANVAQAEADAADTQAVKAQSSAAAAESSDKTGSAASEADAPAQNGAHADAGTSDGSSDQNADQSDRQANNQAELAQDKAQLAADGRDWQASMTQMVELFRRIPYALGLFCLNLVSIMMFPLMALIIQSLDPSPDKQTLQAVWSISWLASVALGVWVAGLRALFAPLRPWMRLIPCSDQTAWFFFRGLKRIGTVSSWGVTALIILRCCTLPANVLDSLAKLLMLIVHIMIAVMILGSRPLVRHACDRVVAHKPSLRTIMRIVSGVWWVAALFFDFSLWLVWAMGIPGGYQLIFRVFLHTCITLAIMRAFSILILGAFERVLSRLENSPRISNVLSTRITTYAPVIEKMLNVILLGLTAVALLLAWGVPLRALIGPHSFGAKVFSSLTDICLSVFIGFCIWEAANMFFERRINLLLEEGNSRGIKARVARLRTLQPMMRIILFVSLTILIGLTTLSDLGVNIAPLLAGASIFGVALGFGAQKLVQDFISGIFLLLENAFTVGDAVTLNGTYGIVEKLSLRTVHVRADDGSMNIFPFSSLSQTVNYNREFGRALIVADVAYDSNIGDVIKAFHDITAEMRNSEDYGDLIIDDFQLWGVSSLNDSSVTVKGALPTIPPGRLPVQREFNRRMLVVFAERGIDFPYPTRTLDVPVLDTFLQQERENRFPLLGGNESKDQDSPNGHGKGKR
ncbi:mechanosensitive ion channel domain-containing protein [Oecophyllibacter saccharovorans]|uniref:mechanosensitive ion channel domain-containing protein n=1 Tax=Oecophyllibacter saccharovorans TaxID=2558360 RepID=UPI001167043C|nr:mechanosensitive ion channel domain-containing protein [Oecophyllibacter saccharovorans]TPW35151.1 mechanosensitive ion channel [Oecophyllibacter saccharovorans]